MSKIIYIADDEKNIRELIKSFLENAGYQVKTFENGDQLLKAFKQNPSDLIILDVMMPGTDGVTLCTEIREISSVPIIIVSARDSEFDRITGITAGSDDYLIKPFSPSELVVRVHAIFRRIALSSEKVACDDLVFADLKIDENQRCVYRKDKIFEVSPTEYAFLRYMVMHKERAVSREELLLNVWHFDTDIDTRATDDVVKRLRKKLVQTKVRIEAVWGYGFILKEVPHEEIT